MKFFLLIFTACLFFVSCEETELKHRTIGYKGEAKTNPFLAAERFLNEQGHEASSERGLSNLNDKTSTLFVPVSSINTVSRTKMLLDWVDSGGHLVVMMEGGEIGGYDFVVTPDEPFWDIDELSSGLEHMLDQLDIKYTKDLNEAISGTTDPTIDEWEEMEENDRVLLGSEMSEIDLGDGGMFIHHWATYSFQGELHEYSEYASKDADNRHHYLSVIYGSGRVSMLSDARPLRNRYFAYGDHAQFVVALIELSRGGNVIFYAGAGDGFLAMLWRHFKMAIIGLLVVVALWLWRHLPRFGPTEDITEGSSREFSAQIRGTGRFLWRNKRDDVLLGSLRARVNRKLALQPGANHEGVFDQLVDMTGLPLDSVIEAMTREYITEPSVMLRVTNNIQKILKKIH